MIMDYLILLACLIALGSCFFLMKNSRRVHFIRMYKLGSPINLEPGYINEVTLCSMLPRSYLLEAVSWERVVGNNGQLITQLEASWLEKPDQGVIEIIES